MFPFPNGNDAMEISVSLSNRKIVATFNMVSLATVLQIPDEIVCSQRFVCYGMEATCILLKRLAYPCRYTDTTGDTT